MLRESRDLLTTDVVVFAIVNVTNVAQTIGFLSRTSGTTVQHVAGIAIMLMALPAAWVLWADRGAGLPAWQHVGPALFIAFALVELALDYVWHVEFRQPRQPLVLVPYLLLFFGSILLLGLRLFPVSRTLWGITAVTAAGLLGAMVWAQIKGVG